MITVSDTDTRIDPDDLPHVFRHFFSTKQGGGIGLGLSVCERVIKNHGGSTEVESTQGQATTFFVYLPALQEAQALSTV